MVTIFVDVDDTLVLYDDSHGPGPHPYGVKYGVPWEPNKPLIQGIKEVSRLGFPVIVWSGGGRQYAQQWVWDLELEHYVAGALEKSPDALHTLPKAGDIVINDLPVIGRTHEPHEWLE